MRSYRIPHLEMRENNGMRIGLGYSDEPTAFNVAAENGIIKVYFVYPADTQEEDEEAVFNEGITIRRGRYSSRLFSITISVSHSRDMQTTVQTILNQLRKTFNELEKGQRFGPRLNYQAAGAGLGLGDTSSPPAWLVDVVERKNTARIPR